MQYFHRRLTILFVLALILGVSTANNRILQSSSFATTPSRTSSVKQSCAGLSRQSISTAASQSTSDLQGFLRGYFGLDGAKVMNRAIRGDSQAANNELNSNLAPIVMLILPFGIGGAILALISPILLICCLFRPWCCRSIRFWQRDQSEWSWKETKIPAIIGAILLVGCIAMALTGFVYVTKFKTAYDNSVCARAIVFDDTINGNVSASGSYFVGIQKFQNTIPSFLQNFNAISDSYASVTSTSGTIKIAQQNLGEVVTQLTNIPTGDGKQLNLQYPGPLNAKNTTTLIRSQFPGIIGSVYEPSSMLGKAHTRIANIKSSLDKVAAISDYYREISGPSTKEIGIAQNDMEVSIVSLYNADRNLQENMKDIQDIPYWLTIGAYATFACVLVFATGGLVANICMAWKNRIRWRWIGYISLVALFFLGLLAFALTVTSAITLPAGLFLCQFVDGAASNSQNFKENLAGIIHDQKTLVGMSECMTSSLGTMLGSIVGQGLIKSIQAIPESVAAMNNVNPNGQTAIIIDNFNKMENEIKLTLEAKKLDITDNSSIVILDKLSKSYEYGCLASGFHEDSWIPSLEQHPQKFPCKFGLGAVADHTTCQMSDDFETRAPGCVGCMDTYGLFKFTDTKAKVANALTIRYNGDNCGPFISDLTNVWANYYFVKRIKIGPLFDRYKLAKTNVKNGVETLTRNVQPLFESVIQKLESSAGMFLNPQTGIGAGLNCKLIGQDMNILASNVCNSFLPNLYYLFVILGVLSFAILFTMCTLTCSVARHFDQWLKDCRDHPVKTDSDEAKPTPSQNGKTQSQSGSSRQILKDTENQIRGDEGPVIISEVQPQNYLQNRDLQLKQEMKPAHGKNRYRRRNM